jgi:hypothetical protein
MASNGVLGEVFLHSGIVFDEFDKWDLGTSDRRMTFDAILTGREQGKWPRGVSAMDVRPPDFAHDKSFAIPFSLIECPSY